MEIQVADLLEKYSDLIEWHAGSKEVRFTGVQHPADAAATDLVFVNEPKYLGQAFDSPATAIVVQKRMRDTLPDSAAKTILLSANVPLLMARIFRDLLPVEALKARFEGHRLHPSAVIAKSAKIAPDATVGPLAAIGENVSIGPRTVIGGHCHIERGTQIGEDCHIHAHVFIAHDCVIENRVEVHPQTSIGTEGFGYAHDEKGRHERIRHYGAVIIHDDVDIGAGCTLDRGSFRHTEIGEGTKIDNQCHFAHNTRVDKHCLIAAGLLMAGSSSLGDHVVVGGGCSITGHIEVASHVQLGGASALSKSILQSGAYQGYPTMPLKRHQRIITATRRLPEFRKDVLDMLRELGVTRKRSE